MVYSSSAVVAFAVICILIIVIVLLGNFFIIDAMRRHAHMRTIPNICITSLAVTDLFVGLINIPMYIYSLFHHTEITITYRKVQNVFDIYFGITSILHLVFISMERCYAITFPMQRRLLTKGTMFKILVVLWITAGIPVVLYLTEVAYAIAILSGLFFLVPLLIVIISYTILTVTVKRAFKKTRRFSTHSPNKKEVRLAKTLSIVIIFFVVAWLPYFFVLISFQYPKFIQINLTEKGWYYLAFFVKCLHFSNSGVNPFIYAFRQPEYAKAFKGLCFKSRFRNRGQSQASYTRSSLIQGSVSRRESQEESQGKNNKKENSKNRWCRSHGEESNKNSDKLESHV